MLAVFQGTAYVLLAKIIIIHIKPTLDEFLIEFWVKIEMLNYYVKL